MAEKLITLARKGTLTARRRVIAALNDRRLVDEEQEFTGKSVVQRLFEEIAPKFADRTGGYTRIVKTAKYRIGDAGNIVVLALLTETETPRGTIRRSAGLRRKRNERKHLFAGKALKGDKAEKPAVEAAPATEAAPAPEAAAPTTPTAE